MKRSFPRAVTEVVGLVGLLVLANVGCSPDNDVKPGAPVLTTMSIVEPDGTRFDVTPEATLCDTALKDGDSCDPEMDSICHTADFVWCKCNPVPEPTPPEEPPCTPDQADADAGSADGGASDAAASDAGAADAGASDAGAVDVGASDDATADAGASDDATADASASDDAGASDAGEVAAPKGTWSCKSFAPGSTVIATFDRLIGTTTLGSPEGSDSLVTATVKTAVTPAPTTLTVYEPNGSTGGLIFPLFGENPGPNLKITAQPSWPGSNVVTVALSKTKVLAKDGKTPFASSGAITDGILSFATVPFSGSVTVPPNAFPPPEETDAGTDGGADASEASDAGASDASEDASDASNPDACVPPPPPPPEPTTALADMTPATIAFNAPVDPTAIVSHVHITANGKAYDDQVDVTADATSVTITPKTAWAKSTMFDITVDDTAVDIFGDKIDAASSEGMFTTGDK
jgi:hypothetical protein